MGQKVNPVGFRVGVYRDWTSRWFARGSYGKQLLEDLDIRKYLRSILENAEIARIEIEKAGSSVRVIIHTARPGVVIGKKGQEIEQIKQKLAQRLNRQNVEISVQEVRKPELNAQIVAQNIASQLEKRTSYKRAMKRAASSAMRSGAKGIKICCAGRLQGAEIARRESITLGALPLHTLRADIDYAFAQSYTTYGVIGVKVWIYKGEFQRVST